MPTPSSGLGYTNLVGDSHMKEYVLDLNLMTIPTQNRHHRTRHPRAAGKLGRQLQRNRNLEHLSNGLRSAAKVRGT